MSGVAGARVIVRAPRAALSPFVKRLLVVESKAAHNDSHLPDTGLVAAFSFRGECRLEGGGKAPAAAITGLWDTVRGHAHSEDHAVVIASFTAVGAAALLRQPLDEFANTTVDFGVALDRKGDGLDGFHDRLATAADHDTRFRLVEDLLLSYVQGSRPDPYVAAAVGLIERSRASMRVEAIACQLGLSQSALERRFRRLVGASPRRFASLVRLGNVVRLHEAGADLTTIAHAAGYYDQPHFIKDFKRFTGLSPGAFFDPA